MKKQTKTLLFIAAAIAAAYIIYSYFFKEKRESGEIGADSVQAKNNNMTIKNFKLSEFACKDGTPVPKQYERNCTFLMQNLQVLRNELGTPIIINSGYRTPTHNATVGGAANSMHLKAAAADIKAVGFTAKAVREKILELIASGKMQDGGLGSYSSFTHYDIGNSRRWNG